MTSSNTTEAPCPRDQRYLSPLLRVAPTMAAAGALVSAGGAVVALMTEPGADYSAIFPPPWLGLIGAGLIVVALALRLTSPGRVAQTTAWTAAIVLLGASGGVLLDGFRAFFVVTGIPAGDFAQLDATGAIAR